MYLPTTLLLPLFSLFSSPSSTRSQRYPNHQVLTLNDGNVIPSPAYGCGSANFAQNVTTPVLLALSLGWRHIDNARVYGNEKSVGDAIRGSGLAREELYITSKYDALNGTSVRDELNQTLTELGTSYLDLYLIHFPAAASRGGGISKVWREMEAVQAEGLVKSIGVSNYDDPALLEEVLKVGRVKPAVNQVRYHVYNALNHTGMLALSAKHGIVTEAYGALAPVTRIPGGPADKTGQEIADRLGETVGEEVTVAQAILNWLRSTKVVAVTTSTKDYRLKEQLKPFAEEFPEVTAAEVKEYELSGWAWEGAK